METYEQINRLKYNIENKTLKDWALKFGITDLASLLETHRELYLGGTMVRRKDLSANDRDIIKRVFSWLRGNS